LDKALFVCGSMAAGMVHFNKIAPYIRSVQSARAQGAVYRLEIGYPVFIAEGSENIEGSLVRITSAEILFKVLDQFHGYSPQNPEKSLHHKKEIPVWIEEISQLEVATAYTFNPLMLPVSALPIPRGEWRKSLEQNPALTHQLSPRQIAYIKKLGSSSGRDIIPIDMNLYRELVRLEMVVDKGRRLALTRLGQEAYHYLA
jgi:gamma-glutamylcyclotransferase (GGCT)/AIG2-like uncharacterized protein YtfP